MTARSGDRDRGSVVPVVVLGVVAVTMTGVLGMLLAVVTAGAAVRSAGSGGCGPAGTGQQISGVRLDADQMGNAATIVGMVAARHLPPYAAVVAVATAYQESRLRNLPYGDAAGPDSAGLFQQRPSTGWGTRAQVLDPVHATGAFLDHLIGVPGWTTIPLTTAAQQVQRSAYPTAYAPWQGLATGLVAHLWPTATAGRTALDPLAAPGAPRDAGPDAGAAASVCPGAGGASGPAAEGSTRIPDGFEITGSPTAQTAIRYALAQLGKPYRWGAAGPDTFDCSGLTMTAWAAAGIALPHFTGDQVRAGTPEALDLSQASGGDLIFIPGTDGTRAAPGHVGMIAGRIPAAGRPTSLVLVQAPQTGRPVTLTPLSAWTGQIVAVRHIA